MTLLASCRTGLLFVLEDDDLLFLALFFDLAGDLGSVNIRST